MTYYDDPVMPRHLHGAGMDLERDHSVSYDRAARAVDLLHRSGVSDLQLWPAVEALVFDRHPNDRGVTPDLRLANALARHRGVRGRVESDARVLRVSYDLARSEPVWFADTKVGEVFDPHSIDVADRAPVTDGHDGPQLGAVVAAELRGFELDMWLQLNAGPVQDDLLASAYFRDRDLHTSIRFSDDPHRTSLRDGQLLRRGVTVHHLAFCADPMRQSTVARADVPTTAPHLRGAVAVLGPHTPAPVGASVTHRGPSGSDRDGYRPERGDQTRAVGRVLRVGGQPMR